MIRYATLRPTPKISPALTGLTLGEFERLAADLAAAHARTRAASTPTKRGAPRRRAPGAGAPPSLDRADRLLLAPVWLRISPTSEVLGWLSGLEKSNAWEDVRGASAVLTTPADFPFQRPAADRARLATPAAVIAASPGVAILIDAEEQPSRRPQGGDQQEPFDSGKEERPPLKDQVVRTPEGRIGGASDTTPGSIHDPPLMRGDGIRGRLDEGESAMADKASTGGQEDRPGTPLVGPAKATRGHPLTTGQEGANRVISGYRAVIEHVLAQLDRFQVLKPVFRSAFERPTGVIRVVAALVDRRIATVPLKAYATN